MSSEVNQGAGQAKPTRFLSGRACSLARSKSRLNVASTFVAQIVTFCLTVASSVVIARTLGPEGKGEVSLTILLPNMLCLVLNAGIASANTYFAGSRRYKVPELSSDAVMISLLAAGAGAAIVAVLFASGWTARIVPGLPLGLQIFALSALPLLLLNLSLSGILQGNQNIVTVNVISIVQAFCLLAFCLLLVVGMKLGVWGAVTASLLSIASAAILLLVMLRREGADLIPRWDSRVVQSTIGYGLKNYIANLLQFFNYRLDLLLVNYFLGAKGVGFYTVSVGMAETLWYFPNAVAFVLFPKSASEEAAKMNKVVPRVLMVTMGVTALGASGLVIGGRLAIRVMYSSAFLASYVPMLALLPGVMCLSATKVLTADIAGRGYPIFNSAVSGFGLIATMILDLTLIPRHGVLGASIASSVAYFVTLVAAIGFHRIGTRRSKQRQERGVAVVQA